MSKSKSKSKTTGQLLANVVAMTALDMIGDDPELIERLRKYAADRNMPFASDDLNGLVITIASSTLLDASREAIDADEEDGQVIARGALVIPIPKDGGARAAQDSADALAAGSMTTEFVHSAEGVLEQFNGWLTAKGKGGADIKRETLEKADTLLTLMSHVSRSIAEREGGDQGDLNLPPEAQVI